MIEISINVAGTLGMRHRYEKMRRAVATAEGSLLSEIFPVAVPLDAAVCVLDNDSSFGLGRRSACRREYVQ